MKRKLLLLFFLTATFSYAQYIESAPWMMELEKKKKTTFSKVENKGYTLWEISKAFEDYWTGKDITKKGIGYKPFKRWEYYWSHFIDENGYLPSSTNLWEDWLNRERNTNTTNLTSDWTSIGPFISQSQAQGQPGIGRINAIAVDPNNENIWYAGAPAGGIWKSIDAGDSWVNIFDDFPQIGVSGIAIDPTDSNIIYIATGDDDASDSFSIGVFKSLDGGDTWNETGLNPLNSENFNRMNEIFINPQNTNIIWVATNGGLQRSLDAGDTWEIVLEENITDFRLKPGDPNVIYAVTSDTFFRSLNGGDNFIPLTNSVLPSSTANRMVLGVTEANPEVVYILIGNRGADDDNAFVGLFKSSNGGQTFTEGGSTQNIVERNQVFYDFAIAVSPTDENTVFTGAINIWRTTDSGESFIRLNNNDNTVGPAYTHVDIHTLKFFNNRLFTGTDGGLYVSNNNGSTFTNRTDGIAVTQFYKISVSAEDSNFIVGGTQDNSGIVFNGSEWNVFTGGDGMDYEIDPNNENLVYGFVQFGNVLFISTNQGQTVSAIRSPADPDNPGEFIQGNWITPLEINGKGEVFAGYNQIYRLDGNQWSLVSTGFTAANPIEDMEIDQNDDSIIYIADSNVLRRSEDGGVTFREVTFFSGIEISDIEINNNDSNIVYVTTSLTLENGQRNQPTSRGVFRVTIDETNLSNSLVEDLTLNLPVDLAFFSIAHQGNDSTNPIFVGTNLGVYRLDDTLTEWENYFTNLPATAVGDLEFNLNENVLVAGTYGRGSWITPIPRIPFENDIALESINPSNNAILCGEIFPEINVINNGSAQITEVNVTFNVNGGEPQDFLWTGVIEPEETFVIPLPSINISDFGFNIIDASVSIPDESLTANNSSFGEFYFNKFGVGDELNTFETEEETIIAFNTTGSGSVWEKGVPSGTLLNATSSGNQVFATNLSGNYPDNTTGALVSECYEFSSIVSPVLRFSMAYDLEINFDIVFVEYSTDNGTSWNVLGNTNSIPNWYNSNRTNESSGAANDCQNCPGAQWTGTNTTLTEYAYDFEANAANGETDLTNEDNIIFRIIFQSDEALNQEGVVIDDFIVAGIQDDDDDNDGVLDVDDNCPLVGNSNQLDTDGDGFGEPCDNCPDIFNIDQADFDNDGIGDSCETDIDNDGVLNEFDLCPETPEGATVDVDGCEIFSLPTSNFRVLTVGESCINNENGVIRIEAEANLNYTAVLSGVGNSFSVSQNFTDTVDFNDLSSGMYTLCITVENQEEYENCLNVSITEPNALSVSSKVSTLKKEITLNLSGGSNYTITLNGRSFNTTEDEITIALPKLENVLQVRTDKDCQGIHTETILLNSEAFIYPNPISNGNLTIIIGEQDRFVTSSIIALYSIKGNLIFSKSMPIVNGKVEFNVDALRTGIYLLNVKTENTLSNYKIIRK
ncbi:thrombospondin type 3 repeat-containing protein [uncultured Croceitalea sp.]|uniref:thrombospondin type 3 repeat-containing protein n=1 Tax=uncultured Croceitalea sp. TaxID=1798908 RepID=UPI00374F576A